MWSDEEIQRTVGLIDTKSALFVKQYGDRRTGTNATRALISANFVNAFVLMHILGDKHAPPVDLEAIAHAVRDGRNAAWDFVISATYSMKAETSKWGEYFQMRFIKALDASILQAFEEDRIRYVISVRDPYRWAEGFLRHLGFPALDESSWDHRLAVDVLIDGCVRFNNNHRAWWAMHQRRGARSLIVHAEKLIDSWAEVLTAMESRLGLTKQEGGFVPLTQTVHPTHWDFDRSSCRDEWFDVSPPASAPRLTEALREVVTTQVDWETMERFGYSARASGTAGVARTSNALISP